MRTTIDIDPTALEAARQLAVHRGQSLGAAVSELILKGLQSEAKLSRRSGFPVFPAGPQSRPITLEDVRQAEDDSWCAGFGCSMPTRHSWAIAR